MTYPQIEAFPSDKQSVLIVITVISLFIILFYFYVYKPQMDEIDKIMKDWDKQRIVNEKETKMEQDKLNKLSCPDLKIAIGNNEFTQLNQQANNQYLGRCT